MKIPDDTERFDAPDDDAEFERQYWRQRNKGGKRFTCPTCKKADSLTAYEVAQGYQCNACADKEEGLP